MDKYFISPAHTGCCYDGTPILERPDGMLEAVKIHNRPHYTPKEAQQVVDWLNGKDQPLTNMVPVGHDRFLSGINLRRILNHAKTLP